MFEGPLDYVAAASVGSIFIGALPMIVPGLSFTLGEFQNSISEVTESFVPPNSSTHLFMDIEDIKDLYGSEVLGVKYALLFSGLTSLGCFTAIVLSSLYDSKSRK